MNEMEIDFIQKRNSSKKMKLLIFIKNVLDRYPNNIKAALFPLLLLIIAINVEAVELKSHFQPVQLGKLCHKEWRIGPGVTIDATNSPSGGQVAGISTFDAIKIQPNIKFVGIHSKLINTKPYQGRKLKLSYSIKIDKVNRWKSASANWNYFISYIDFYDSNHKMIRRGANMTYREKSPWRTISTELTVPKQAQSMDLWFHFALASGEAYIADINLSVNTMISTSYEYSKDFNRCLLVEPRNSPFSPASIAMAEVKGTKVKHPRPVNHISFDGKSIYFNVETVDRNFIQRYRDDKTWNGDSVQMAFDVDCLRGNRLGFKDYELCFSQVEGRPDIYAHKVHGEVNFDKNKIPFSLTRDKDKSRYQIEIPWNAIVLSASTKRLGYSYLVNEYDKGDDRITFGWPVGVAEPMWNHPVNFGSLVFDHSSSGIGADLYYSNVKKLFSPDESIAGTVFVPSLNDKFKSVNCRFIINSGAYDENLTFPVTTGENRIHFSLPLKALKVGSSNELTVIVEAMPGHVRLMEHKRRFSLFSKVVIRDKTMAIHANIKRKWEVLKTKLAKFGSPESKRPRELFAAAAVVEVFLKLIPQDLNSGLYNIALREAEDTEKVVDNALMRLEKGDYVLSHEKSVANLNFSDGIFRNQSGDALFLFEPYTAEDFFIYPFWSVFLKRSPMPDQQERKNGYRLMKDLGINMLQVHGPNTYTLFDDESLKLSAGGRRALPLLRQKISEAATFNITSWLHGLAHDGVYKIPPYDWPKYLWKKYPETILVGNHGLSGDVDHPEIKRIEHEFLGVYMDALAKEKTSTLDYVLGWDLWNEASMESITSLTEQKFQNFLKKEYNNNLSMLNAAWKTNFSAFADIKNIKPLIAKNKVVNHDWCLFNCKRFAAWLKDMKTAVNSRQAGLQLSCWAKFMSSVLWTGSSTFALGYDRELLSNTFDSFSGGDLSVGGTPHQPLIRFAGGEKPIAHRSNSSIAGWMPLMTYDFLKSIAPDKPVFEGEWHVPDGVKDAPGKSPEYIRLALRLSVLHGMNACSVWRVKAPPRKLEDDFKEYCFANLPVMNDIFFEESIAIDRNMELMAAFQHAPCPIRFYYSPASIVYDSQDYLDVLKSAYEGFNSGDVKLGFATERMIASDKPMPGLKCLVVPNARYLDNPQVIQGLRSLQEKGVKIVLLGNECLTRNGRNQLLKEKLALKNATVWPLPSKDWNDSSVEFYFKRFPQLLSLAKIQRPFTVVQENGGRLRTIEARFAKFNGKDVGYVANLGSNPTAIKILNGKGIPVSVTTMPGNVRRKAGEMIHLKVFESFYLKFE